MSRRLDDGRSFGDLIGDALENVEEIFRTEIQLAKAEVSQEIRQMLRAALVLLAGGVLALFALGFLLFSIIWILDEFVTPLWVAGAIVTTGVAVIAIVLIVIGKARVKALSPTPEQTIQSVKEDVEWIRQQTP